MNTPNREDFFRITLQKKGFYKKKKAANRPWRRIRRQGGQICEDGDRAEDRSKKGVRKRLRLEEQMRQAAGETGRNFPRRVF